MFRRTTAINKLLALKKRKRVIQGGTWAGKTYGIIPCLIDKALKFPKRKITVVAESIPAIKQGALANFVEIMQDTERWKDAQYNGTERTYTFLNGSTIQFTSFDTISKAKAAGKRTDLFINEGNYIPFEIADALMMRTSDDIWIDFNPVEEFWAHTEVLTQDDAEFLLLKYTDNECLPATILQELLNKIEKAKTSSYWRNWVKVYIDGEVGTLEGIIFPDIKIVEGFPKDKDGKDLCKWILYAMDFGYTNDPTTLIKMGEYDGELYLDERLYRTGMTNPDIGTFMQADGLRKGIDEIIADNAEPKSIAELQRMGWRVKPCVKGKDSVVNGIDTLKRYTKNVTVHSRNMIKEFRNYKYEQDPSTGKYLNQPIDEFNHCIDPARYGITHKLTKPITSGTPRSIVLNSNR